MLDVDEADPDPIISLQRKYQNNHLGKHLHSNMYIGKVGNSSSQRKYVKK